VKNLLCNKKFACFGDSITSDQVTGIGTEISALLSTKLVGNFACGWATCSDWHDGNRNITPVSLTVPQNTDTSDNVLSNQVRRILQYTAKCGAQIAWEHPVGGLFSIDPSAGVGIGNITELPELIYIAIGTNDGKNPNIPVFDDTDAVFSKTYASLTLNSFASALRWSIETLRSAYPDAQLFVASPLQTYTDQEWMNYNNGERKREITKKVCRYCAVNFIDAFSESGFSSMVAAANGGVHPNTLWKHRIACYAAREIRNKFRF
jgi:hypothetical protein